MSSRWDSRRYPAARPRAVSGGIRAKSARGKIASTWWSSRFIEVLESFGMGSRLARGKNYARRGQVVYLNLDAGIVTANVQGSRAQPYRVRIGIAAYGKDQWARIEQRLAEDAWFVAQLLAGDMPAGIEQVFTDLDLTLFPSGPEDLSLDCSCPDFEVPCKHLAAVCYLLAERFDADPFELLAWRGRDRDDLLAHLNTVSPGSPAAIEEAVPLTDLLDEFWGTARRTGAVPRSRPDATPLVQLPEISTLVRGKRLADVLDAAYRNIKGIDA